MSAQPNPFPEIGQLFFASPQEFKLNSAVEFDLDIPFLAYCEVLECFKSKGWQTAEEYLAVLLHKGAGHTHHLDDRNIRFLESDITLKMSVPVWVYNDYQDRAKRKNLSIQQYISKFLMAGIPEPLEWQSTDDNHHYAWL